MSLLRNLISFTACLFTSTDAYSHWNLNISDFLISLMHRKVEFEPPKHGSTLFMTQCFGNDYFQTYCIPLLLSWRHAYCGNIMELEKEEMQCSQDHIFVMLVQNVDDNLLRFISSSWHLFGKVQFVPVPTSESLPEHSDIYADGTDMLHNKGNKLRSHADMMYVFAPFIENMENEFDYLVLLDSDMLFVEHLDNFLDSKPWDVSFTYYDEVFDPPWTETDKGGKNYACTSKNGFFTRIQGAVLLFNLQSIGPAKVASFLRTVARTHEVFMYYWGHNGIMQGGKILEYDEVAQTDAFFSYMSREEFRGPFQGALAQVLSGHSEHDIHDLLGTEQCDLCNGTASVTINALGLDDLHPAFKARIRGVPAHLLNQAESLNDGHFYEGLVLYHLKGAWWRGCLPTWQLCLPGMSPLADADFFAKIEWRLDPISYWVFFFELIWVPHCRSYGGDVCDFAETAMKSIMELSGTKIEYIK